MWCMMGRKEEGGRRGAGVGDYTIIQITAGNNLVADVSWSTMPTAHRRACVTHQQEFNAQKAAKQEKKKKRLLWIQNQLTKKLFSFFFSFSDSNDQYV